MPFPDSLMARDERVVLHKHPHWKVLVLPGLAFVLIIAAATALATWVSGWESDSGVLAHRWWYLADVIVAVVLLLWLCVAPLVRWATEHFVLTTGHVFFRTGLLHRRQHQIPLSRVQNIETMVGFWGRVLRFGSLVVESAADEPLEFSNVARISTVQGMLNQLIADDRASYPDPADPRTRFSRGAPDAPDWDMEHDSGTARD